MLKMLKREKVGFLKTKTSRLMFILMGIALLSGPMHINRASAADNNFADGITVDSTLDTADNFLDGICDDGAGNCTLRAAIEEANNTAGANTITFNIAGGGVKTIQPASALPTIVDTVVINGYSQPGAQANTAVSPQPFNGTLLIQIDGTNAGAVNGLDLQAGSSNSIISGLIINRFEGAGINTGSVALSNIAMTGNYIGTNSTGLTALGNQGAGSKAAIQIDADPAVNITVGGSTAAARNIISGNSSISGIGIGNVASGSIVVRGNYIGLAANGTTDLGNALGASLRAATDVIDNVISGNSGENLYHGGSGAVITNNLVGTTYQGTVSGAISQGGGIVLSQSATEITVGGTSTNDRNIIAGNSRAGVQINSIFLPFPATLTPTKIAVLGNSIFGNTALSYLGGSVPGLGIDLFHVVLDGSFQPQSVDEEGVTPNDVGDADTGANNYINFPVLHTATQNGDALAVSFDLDAADSSDGTYRVEFFANDAPNSTGYGAGQTYLGSTTVANGSNRTANLTLASDDSLAGKSISATTTAIDTTTDSGFGATSEFSANITASLVGSTSDNQLAATGDNQLAGLVAALICLSIPVAVYSLKLHHRNG